MSPISRNRWEPRMIMAMTLRNTRSVLGTLKLTKVLCLWPDAKAHQIHTLWSQLIQSRSTLSTRSEKAWRNRRTTEVNPRPSTGAFPTPAVRIRCIRKAREVVRSVLRSVRATDIWIGSKPTPPIALKLHLNNVTRRPLRLCYSLKAIVRGLGGWMMPIRDPSKVTCQRQARSARKQMERRKISESLMFTWRPHTG